MSYSVRKDQQKEMKILQIIKAVGCRFPKRPLMFLFMAGESHCVSVQDLVDRGDANSVEDANANARQQQRQQAGSVMGLLIGEGNVDKLKEAVAKMV